MNTGRPEIKPESSPALGSQNRISILNLDKTLKSVVSLSEHIRAYHIYNRTSCIEIRNFKDNWTVQIEEKDAPVTAITLSPEGELITASHSHFTRWKNITSQTPEPERIQLKSKPLFAIQSMQFSPTGELISGHTAGHIFSWDLKTGESKHLAKVESCKRLDIDRYGNLTCLTMQSDYSLISDVYCWDKNHKLIGKHFVRDCVVRLSEDQIALAELHHITIWDLKREKEIASITTRSVIEALSLSPEGLLVASGTLGLIEFFDLTTYQKVTDIQLNDMSGSRVFWNSYGYLTCVGKDAIIDMKCDIQDYLDKTLSLFINDNVARYCVRPYLFFTPPKKTETPAVTEIAKAKP